MGNPIYGNNIDDDGHHVSGEDSIFYHDIISRITRFAFPPKRGCMSDDLTSDECKLIAMMLRNWVTWQDAWKDQEDTAWFQYGITTTMPPLIKDLFDWTEKYKETSSCTMPKKLRDRVRKARNDLRLSTIDPGDDLGSLDKIVKSILKIANFYEHCNGTIPEKDAFDDDLIADFDKFTRSKHGLLIPFDQLVREFVDRFMKDCGMEDDVAYRTSIECKIRERRDKFFRSASSFPHSMKHMMV